MIKDLTDLPPGVVGFEISGTVHADDYRDVVLPALQRAYASDQFRFVIETPGGGGYGPC